MSDGILSDRAIHNAILRGDIVIDPFQESQLNPTSYDLTLGPWVAVYSDCVQSTPASLEVQSGEYFTTTNGALDAKKPLSVEKFRIHPENGWLLRPGIGYLLHTAERLYTKIYVPVLDGKSTVGRLFVSIHETAGYGDPGFDGQFTLEVTCTHPVRLYSGMRIGQVRFHTVHGEIGKTYDKTGSYRGTLAEGPVPSQSNKLFRSG